jgi:folate-binding protein YgfZ
MQRPLRSQSPYRVGSGPAGPPVSAGLVVFSLATSLATDKTSSRSRPFTDSAASFSLILFAGTVSGMLRSVPEWRPICTTAKTLHPMKNNGSTQNEQSGAATPASLNQELGAVCISGSDRLDFLQGQLTQDVALLVPGKPLLAGWANAKGRLLCVTWMFDWLDQVWLVMPADLCEEVARRLKMFVLRADARVEVASQTVSPLDRQSAKTLIKTEDGHTSDCFYNSSHHYFEPADDTGLITGPATEARSLTGWRLNCIRAGLPMVWPTTREAFVPQMLNLDLLNGISFTKGCYVGQEIVARTQNLGKIKRRMYGFTNQGAAISQPGDPVYADGQTVGEVVDAVCSADQNELLAVIRIEAINSGLSLDLEGKHQLLRRELPYTVPESL